MGKGAMDEQTLFSSSPPISLSVNTRFVPSSSLIEQKPNQNSRSPVLLASGSLLDSMFLMWLVTTCRYLGSLGTSPV